MTAFDRNPTPEELRRMIDEALAEIDDVEADVIALFETLGGPDLAARLLKYYEAAVATPRTTALRRPPDDEKPSS